MTLRSVATSTILIVLALGLGLAVTLATFPDADQLKAAGLDELGMDAGILDSPAIAPMVDSMTARVEQRLVREVRTSIIAGVAVGVVVAALAATVVAQAGRRDPEPVASLSRSTLVPAGSIY